jgi:hypothetical protein
MVYGGLILGSERIVGQTLNWLEEGLLEDEDITHRKKLQTRASQKGLDYLSCSPFRLPIA